MVGWFPTSQSQSSICDRERLLRDPPFSEAVYHFFLCFGIGFRSAQIVGFVFCARLENCEARAHAKKKVVADLAI